MKRNKRGTDRRIPRIFGCVCLSFLVGTAGGALLANLLPAAEWERVAAVLGERQGASYAAVFWKYLKYDLLIWLGGWLRLGLVVSGATFLFRSVATGFTAAMLLTAYGVRGLLLAAATCLPQNLLLIPTYVLLGTAAVYYLLSWQEGEGKRALRRERRRKQTEYCILFAASLLPIAAAAGVEWLLPVG